MLLRTVSLEFAGELRVVILCNLPDVRALALDPLPGTVLFIQHTAQGWEMEVEDFALYGSAPPSVAAGLIDFIL